MATSLLPENTDPATLTTTTVLTITETARSTRWEIATMGADEEGELILETAKAVTKGKLPATDSDQEWAAGIIEAIAAHGFKLEDEGDIEIDTPIRLTTA